MKTGSRAASRPLLSDSALGGWAGAVCAALSAARGRRVFHPDGVAFSATVTSALLDADERPAVVRVSRAFGLPAWLPDIPGLAIKIPDLYGRGRDQDFLLVGVIGHRWLRLLPQPGWAMLATSYSTLLPYEDDRGAAVIIGARRSGTARTLGAAPGRLRFEITIASPRRRWQRIGIVQVRHRLDADAAEALRFNPWNTGEALRPAGLLTALRDRAYQGSQRARLRHQARAASRLRSAA